MTSSDIRVDRFGNAFRMVRIDCPICDMRDLEVLGIRGGTTHRAGKGVPTEVVRCRRCSLLFCDPFPIPEDPQHLYGDPETYFASHDAEQSRRTHRSLIERAIELSGVASPSILDIGCGRGDLLHQAQEMGVDDVVGLDFSASMVEYARERFGVDALQMTAEEYAASTDRTFDVVILNAVIEHVYDPDSLIAAVETLTRPGSALFLDTPRDPNLVTMVGNAVERLRRRNAVYNLAPTWAPFHVFGFNPKSLRRILDKHGFELEHLRSHTGNPTIPPTAGVGGRAKAIAGTQLTRMGNLTGLATNMDGWALRVR